VSTDQPDVVPSEITQPRASALVTGATGFVGHALATALLQRGWLVHLLVRDRARLDPQLATKCRITVGDLSNQAALRAAVDSVEFVFHCAANVNTWDTRAAYYETNVTGVANLLEAIKERRSPLRRYIHVSTVDVYGYPELPATEDSPTDGAGFGYGETKLLGEQLVGHTCSSAGMPFVILRPCNIIGPGSQFIGRIGAELTSGLMLKIDGGQANAGLLHIDNLVNYLIWSATAHDALNQCFNVRDAEDISWSEFIDRFKQGIHGHGLVINLPFRMAAILARGWNMLHRTHNPLKEPMLHPLLIRIFGRTCGHSAFKIHSVYDGDEMASFDEAMQESISWYIDSVAATQR
jgi:nucleoside-diphosphate-sugar epimerase